MTCDFACWDRIADAINPTLAILSLGLLIFGKQVRRVGRQQYALVAVTLIAAVYAMQWVDQQLGLWASWGGDYSTHTAFAIASAIPIALLGRRWLMTMAIVVLSYAALMLKQHYHTISDISTTSAYIAVIALPMLVEWRKTRSSSSQPRAPEPS